MFEDLWGTLSDSIDRATETLWDAATDRLDEVIAAQVNDLFGSSPEPSYAGGGAGSTSSSVASGIVGANTLGAPPRYTSPLVPGGFLNAAPGTSAGTPTWVWIAGAAVLVLVGVLVLRKG